MDTIKNKGLVKHVIDLFLAPYSYAVSLNVMMYLLQFSAENSGSVDRLQSEAANVLVGLAILGFVNLAFNLVNPTFNPGSRMKFDQDIADLWKRPIPGLGFEIRHIPLIIKGKRVSSVVNVATGKRDFKIFSRPSSRSSSRHSSN